MNEPVPGLQARALCRTYRQGGRSLEVLRGAELTVAPGESVGIIGNSGSGKSTLLHLLAGLDEPDGGEVRIDGLDFSTLPERQREYLRNRRLGFVYQFHHLLPEFTAQENVAMPLLIRRQSRPEAMAVAAALLLRVGLGERLLHRPSELSGGERQRVAVARALAGRPRYVLADEPTGNLDEHSAREVLGLIRGLVADGGLSLLMVTHDARLFPQFDRVYLLRDGSLQEQPRDSG